MPVATSGSKLLAIDTPGEPQPAQIHNAYLALAVVSAGFG